MKSARFLSLVLLVAPVTLVAQEHPTVNAQPNTVFVGADGKYESAPDTAHSNSMFPSRMRLRRPHPACLQGR